MSLRLFTACLFTIVLAAGAQHFVSAAEHTGQVTFAGGPLPGAIVSATQGDRRVTTTTDRDGVYQFRDLEDGVWTIRVEMRGFAPATREETIAGDRAAAPAPASWELALLPLDEITRAGTVTAGLPAADRPAPGQVATSPPAAPRSPAARTEAAPQTPVPVAAGARAPVPAGPPQSTATGTIPGALEASLAAALAGDQTPSPLFGTADSFLVNGSVLNAAASPFSQRQAFGTARVVLARSPYRVTASVNGRSSALDARPVGTVRPSNHNLGFSGSLSGPLRIPRLVRNGPNFTLTFSRSDSYNATSSLQRLPTARERIGDFSQSAAQIIDPDTGQPFPGNVIPAERLSPEALALLAYYPQAGSGDERTNFQAASLVGGHDDSVSFQAGGFNLRQQTVVQGLNLRYSRGLNTTTTPFAFQDLGRRDSLNAGIRLSHRLSPSMVLSVGSTLGRNTSRTEPHFAHRFNVSRDAGITGNNQDPDHWGPPTLTFRTIDALRTGDHARSQALTSATVVETSWNRRRHVLLFGGEIERRLVDLVSQQNPRGAFFFSGAHTGFDVADFLLGLPQTSTIAFGNADKYLRQSSYALFITDDFRVGPSFTMNLGVRWEYEAPVTERRNRLVNLDVAPGFGAVSPVLATDPIGELTGRSYSTSLVRPDRTGIQPRVAIAWRPFLGSSVIVRAGYGIYRNTNVYQGIAQRLAQQPPLSLVASAERSDETPITLADGFLASPTITQNTWAIDPDFRVGYAHNWQALIQRDFPWALQMAATYVGVKGSRLPQVFLPNTWAPGAVNPCPSCPVGFRYLTSGGSSWVHRGQLQIRRRLRNNIEASAQYELAAGRDNASTFVGIDGDVAQNWQDLDAERGPSAIPRHQIGGRFQYTSTIGAGRRGWRGTLLGGWLMNTTVSTASGTPRTPTIAVALPGTAIAGTVRPSLTGAPLSAAPDGYYFNPAAFGPPAAGEWGNVGRGSVRGPGTFALDAALSRSFRAGAQRRMTWQVQASNVLNRVTHTGVNLLVGNPQFGLPVGFTQPRRLSMRLSVQF